jgi:hypothetical protein
MKEGSKGNVRVTERNKEKTEIKKEIRLNEWKIKEWKEE